MQKLKIVFLDAKTVGFVPNMHVLEALGNFIAYPLTQPDDRIKNISDADVVITNKVIIDKTVLDAAPTVKMICVAATGMNNIDTEYAREKGIVVKNVVNYSTDSVAQVTISLILYLVNQVNYFDRYVKSGLYATSDMFTHFGPEFVELKGKRAGIIGLGTIGKRVAHILEAFGMDIVYFSTSGKNNNNDYQRLELDDLLTTSDIVSIHAPLNEQTINLFDASKFSIMKPTAIIVNVGRGGIINEHDLVNAMNNQWIAGAGLDVYEKEPLPDTNPLLRVKCPERLVFTPHIAWGSVEARTLLINKIAENIREFFPITQVFE